MTIMMPSQAEDSIKHLDENIYNDSSAAGGTSPYRIGDSLQTLKINSEMKIIDSES